MALFNAPRRSGELVAHPADDDFINQSTPQIDGRKEGQTPMSRTHHHGKRYGQPKSSNRQIRVRGIRRDPVDMRRLARALIALAQAEAESAAQAEHEAKTNASDNTEASGPTGQKPNPQNPRAA